MLGQTFCVIMLPFCAASGTDSATCDGSHFQKMQETTRSSGRKTVLMQKTSGFASQSQTNARQTAHQQSTDSFQRIDAHASARSNVWSTATVASKWQQRLHAAQKQEQRWLEGHLVDDGYEEEQDASDSRKDPRNSFSLLEAPGEPLNAQGYNNVVAGKNNQMMELFIKRLITDLGMKVVDPGGLRGFVPYYSGEKDTQSFAALREELLFSAISGGWVQFTSEGWQRFASSVRREEQRILIQTGVARNEEGSEDRLHSLLQQSSSSISEASLSSGALCFLAKIPQITYDFIGIVYATIICASVVAMMCSSFYEGTTSTKNPNGYAERDLLDCSPENLL